MADTYNKSLKKVFRLFLQEDYSDGSDANGNNIMKPNLFKYSDDYINMLCLGYGIYKSGYTGKIYLDNDAKYYEFIECLAEDEEKKEEFLDNTIKPYYGAGLAFIVGICVFAISCVTEVIPLFGFFFVLAFLVPLGWVDTQNTNSKLSNGYILCHFMKEDYFKSRPKSCNDDKPECIV